MKADGPLVSRWHWVAVHAIGIPLSLIDGAITGALPVVLLSGAVLSSLQFTALRRLLQGIGLNWVAVGTVSMPCSAIAAYLLADRLPPVWFGEFTNPNADIEGQVSRLMIGQDALIHWTTILSLLFIFMATAQAMFLRLNHRSGRGWLRWNVFAAAMTFAIVAGPSIVFVHTRSGPGPMPPFLVGHPTLLASLIDERQVFIFVIVAFGLFFGLLSYPATRQLTIKTAWKSAG